MKHFVLFLTIIVLFAYCDQAQEEENEGITGIWRLTEVLADPGDGSGVFREVESGKEITFYEDGTVKSNGQLCRMSDDDTNPTEGYYSLEDSTIISGDCTLQFKIESGILIIHYPCIEPCGEKYVKMP